MNLWPEAIGFEADEDGQPTLATIVQHLRTAVTEAGFVTRGRITSGLKESYRPMRVDETLLGQRRDEALDLLTKTGDLIQLTTATGRAFAPSQARRVRLSDDRHVLLGAAEYSEFTGPVRQGPASATGADAIPLVSLEAEIGLADWRLFLVELGGADEPSGNAMDFSNFAASLARSGQPVRLDDSDIAVLSGRGDFFGGFDKPISGRWQNPGISGCFPAAIRKPYGSTLVIVSADGSEGSFWQPPSRDVWRWATIGFTLSLGDPIYRFDRNTGVVKFMVPLPLQLERLMLLTSPQESTWSWGASDATIDLLDKLTGRPDQR